MGLENLPPELLSLVLQTFDNLQDLYSMICASPTCYRIYAQSPGFMLRSVLENAIPRGAFRDVLAISWAPRDAQLASSATFLQRYFGHEPFDFPTKKQDVVAICRLYLHTSYFVGDYIARAKVAIALGRDVASVAAITLSETERTRLFRAFFRFELYCRVFPVHHNDLRDSPFSAAVQCLHFVSRLRPWQMEEMSCVHHYFTHLMSTYMTRLEDEFMEAVFNTPGLQRSASHRQGDLESFREIDVSDLSLFSSENMSVRRDMHTYLASLGSSFVRQLSSADDNGRREIIRRNTPTWSDFFPTALEIAASSPAHTWRPVEDDAVTDPAASAGLGYFLCFKSDHGPYEWLVTPDRCPLRARAHVFWDLSRGPHLEQGLRFADGLNTDYFNRIFGHPFIESVQDKLEGVLVPTQQMKKLEARFGTLLGQTTRDLEALVS